MGKVIFSAFAFFAVAFGFVAFNTTTSAEEQSFANKFSLTVENQTQDQSGTYSFDKAHSFIGFRIKHYGLIEVPGYFRDFTGTVNYNAADPTKSTVEFTAKATSVDTGVAPRDTHLRTADFFEVEKYPELSFKSTKIAKNGKQWMVTGDFTMKGVTKSISFPFDIAGIIPQRNGLKMGLTAETMVNRRDYGINYGKPAAAGAVADLADDVKVVLQIEANKAQPAPAATE